MSCNISNLNPTVVNNHNQQHFRIMENIEDRLYRYRAKRLRFLINGDKFFAGINYALNTEKIRSFDALLNDLNSSLSTDHVKLCKGVRFIFSLDGQLITNLTDFQDGSTYICSSIDTFISTQYRINNGKLNWLIRNSAAINSSGSVIRNRKQRQHQQQQQQQQQQHNISNTSTTTTTNASSKLPQSQQQQTNTPGKIASHPNSNSNTNNNINNSHLQAKPPIPTNNHHHQQHNHGSGNYNQAATTPKKLPVVDSKISHHQQNNTKSNTPTSQQQHQSNIKTPVSIKKPSRPSKDGSNDSAYKLHNKSTNIGNNSAESPTTLKAKQLPDSTTSNTSTTNSFIKEVTDKYDIGTPIGDGHFSVVYRCMNKTTQDFCALKLIDKQQCRGRDDMIYNEVKILKQLSHPNIVKLIEEFDYSLNLYLILELVQDGDLFDAITTVTKFDEVQVSTMIHNLSSALTYLHSQRIVHRDIKPENLLISVHDDGSQSVKLADFGLAVEITDSPLYSVCGTAFYVSPEMLTESGYDFKVDVWATGVICFILLCGYPPFNTENESNQDELFDAILVGAFEFAPQYWNKISQHAKNLIKCMLTVDAGQRYTAEQVFRHPWTLGTSSNFEGINPMNISRKIAQQSQ